jgi:fibronectin-binding autotransporter adhesin
MYVPWLKQLQRYWFPRRSAKTGNASRRATAQRRVRLGLEPLEDRLAPAADAVQTVAANLSTPFSESPQTLSLSAKLSDTTVPSTTVSEGTVTFTVKDSGGNTVGSAVPPVTVSNSAASAIFTLPAKEAAGQYTVAVSYSDPAGHFSDGGDTSGTLTVSASPTTTTTSNVTAPFSTSDQFVTLNATVTSAAGTVNEGSVKFTILQGTTVIGTATSANVTDGSAGVSVSYPLPAGTGAGSYTIEAAYTDSTGNFANSSDSSHSLTVTSTTAAGTSTTASNATASFSSSAQHVTLTANVTSSGGTVNVGTMTFTILQGNTVIGTATSGPVSSGSASVTYALPASLAAGSYTIEANYNDNTGAFANSTDEAHTLTVNQASTTTTGSNATAPFSSSAQTVHLTATVTSSAGTVNEGSVTFTVVDSNGITIGTPTPATVSNGSASANFSLPAGTAGGTYTIRAAYSDTSGNFATSSDNTHTLTVTAAPTTITASNATASFSSSAQNVTLTATVTSSAGTVNEGSVSFTLLDSNGNTVGTSTSGPVSNGSASVNFSLPAGTAAGSYTIEAAYSDSAGSFSDSFDSAHTLTVGNSKATSLSLTTVSITPNVANGTAQMTLTAHVSNPAGTVKEGALSFTVAGVSGKGNVANGSATVQLTVPIQNVLNGFTVALSYADSAKSANFANSTATVAVSTIAFNALLPATVTIDAGNNQTAEFTLANIPLFGATYSSALGGLLSAIDVGSLSVPITFSNVGNIEIAAAEGVPWGMIVRDSGGGIQSIANVQTAADGSLVWVIYNGNHQVIGQMPYG